MTGPILSVIIPTKNRYLCLIAVIDVLKEYKSDEIEFILQDNSSDNTEFLKYFTTVSDNRFKYFYTKENLPIVDNSDKAILNSVAPYVCFIGDDDLIVDNIVEIVKIMRVKDIECLIEEAVTFYWPDINFKYSNKSQKPGSFIITKRISDTLTRIDVKQQLKEVIDSCGTTIGKLPRIYHGIVKRSLIDKVYSHCGTYFPGPSPDMASSVAISHFTDSCYHIHLPFTISGKSAISTSGMGVAHTHFGKLENLDFLPKNIIEIWDNNIPQFWSCSTIWSQSLYSALKACNSSQKLPYRKLYSNLLVFEPTYIDITKAKIIEQSAGRYIKKGFVYLDVLFVFVKRVLNYLKRKFISDSENETVLNVNSIAECYIKVNFMVKKTVSKFFQ